jgi:hypothetical protein
MDIIVVPAYGRDYKSATLVREAWDNGSDFQIAGLHRDAGRYISSRDVAHRPLDITEVWARYNKLTKKIKVHG